MAKSTKYFELFSALKAGADKGVSPETLQKATGFNQGALAVYIHALRHKFGAVIESVRNGRTIVSYRLTNAAELESKILPTRKPRTSTVAKKAKTPAKAAKKSAVVARVTRVSKAAAKKTVAVEDGSVPCLDSDMDITEITDHDLADIRHSLGI